MSKLLTILKIKNRHAVRRFIRGVLHDVHHGIRHELQCTIDDVYGQPIHIKAKIDRGLALPVAKVTVKTELISYTVSLDDFKAWLAIR